METINVINVGGVDKEIEDTVARDSNTTQSSQIQTLTNNLATTNSNLSSEASTRAAADTALGTRIDQIVAPTGEAPNPAEITDARIGVDNTTYNNLGNAIRGQITDTNASIKKLDNEYRKNTVNRGDLLPNLHSDYEVGGINATDGTNLTSNKRLRTANYIPVSDDIVYKFKSTISYAIFFCYASDYTFIDRLSTSWKSGDSDITFLTGTSYIRVIFKLSSEGTEVLSLSDVSRLDAVLYPKENELDDLIKVSDFVPQLDLLQFIKTTTSGESKGVQFTWNEDGTECHVNGTSTGTSDDPARNNMCDMPLNKFVRGGFYRFHVNSEDTNLFLRVNVYATSFQRSYSIKDEAVIFIPESTTRVIIRVQTENGVTVNATIKDITMALANYGITDPVKIRVASYNVGRYNYGYTPSSEHPQEAYSVIEEQMTSFFATHNIDVLGLQESQTMVDGNNIVNKVYMPLYPWYRLYSDLASKPYPTSLYTRFNRLTSGEGVFTSSGRPYVYLILEIHDKLVFVMSVHLALTKAERDLEWDEIAAIVANYDRFIILGDFNAGNGEDWNSKPEYDAILARGWHTANGGYWGQINTYAASDPSAQARNLDSVVTSSNIIITTYDAPYLRDTMPSDHRPIICDLAIY